MKMAGADVSAPANSIERGNSMKVYRLKRADGLFSRGGYKPYFTKKGKIWTSMSGLKNHIHNLMYYIRHKPEYRHENMGKWASWDRMKLEKYLDSKYPNTVVQEYELGVEGVKETPIIEFFNSFFYKKRS